MRLFYEGQPPEKRKEIEASWKQGSLNEAYTRPMPAPLVIFFFVLAILLLAGMTYFTYVHPMRFHPHP